MNFEDAAILHSSFTTTSFTSDYFIKLTSSDLNTRYLDEFYQDSRKFKEFIEILSIISLSFTNIKFLVLYKMIDGKRLQLIKGKFFVQHSRKSKKWKSNSHQDISIRR